MVDTLGLIVVSMVYSNSEVADISVVIMVETSEIDISVVVDVSVAVGTSDVSAAFDALVRVKISLESCVVVDASGTAEISEVVDIIEAEDSNVTLITSLASDSSVVAYISVTVEVSLSVDTSIMADEPVVVEVSWL